MIGYLSGDMAGSPYSVSNGYAEGFELFGTNHKEYYRKRDRDWTAVDFEAKVTAGAFLSMAVMDWLGGYRAKETAGEKVTGSPENVSAEGLAQAVRELGREYSSLRYVQLPGGEWGTLGNDSRMPVAFGAKVGRWIFSDDASCCPLEGNAVLAAVIPVAMAADSENDVRTLAGKVCSVLTSDPETARNAEAVAVSVFRTREGVEPVQVAAYLADICGIDLALSEVDLRRSSVKGEGPKADDGLILSFEKTGTVNRDMTRSIAAALYAFSLGGNFEGVLRKAVSYGGDSPFVAGYASALAEIRFGGIQPSIKSETLLRLDNRLCDICNRFEDRYVTPKLVEGGIRYDALSALKAKFEGVAAPEREASTIGRESTEEERAKLAEDLRRKPFEEKGRSAGRNTVTRMVTEGYADVYFVAEDNLEVRSWLREKYGEGVVIEVPSRREEVWNRVCALSMRGEGTRTGVSTPFFQTLYYHENRKVSNRLTTVTVTEDPAVKVPLSVRREQKAEMVRLITALGEKMQEFQKHVGYTGSERVHFATSWQSEESPRALCVRFSRGDQLQEVVHLDEHTGMMRIDHVGEGRERWEESPFDALTRNADVEVEGLDRGKPSARLLTAGAVLQAFDRVLYDSVDAREARAFQAKVDASVGSGYETPVLADNVEDARRDICESEDPEIENNLVVRRSAIKMR